jgi:hypothetical protein
MIRYEITFDKPGRVFNPLGMVQRIVAHADANHGRITVYVLTKNQEKFEKLLSGCPEVIEYQAHPLDLKSRIEKEQP